MTGVLSKYPVNKGVYDWAIENDLFEVKRGKSKRAGVIKSFSTASQDHFHYEDGEKTIRVDLFNGLHLQTNIGP